MEKKRLKYFFFGWDWTPRQSVVSASAYPTGLLNFKRHKSDEDFRENVWHILPMWYSIDLFNYMFKAEFVTLVSLKVPSGRLRHSLHSVVRFPVHTKVSTRNQSNSKWEKKGKTGTAYYFGRGANDSGIIIIITVVDGMGEEISRLLLQFLQVHTVLPSVPEKKTTQTQKNSLCLNIGAMLVYIWCRPDQTHSDALY